MTFVTKNTVLCDHWDLELHCLLHKQLPKGCAVESSTLSILTSRLAKLECYNLIREISVTTKPSYSNPSREISKLKSEISLKQSFRVDSLSFLVKFLISNNVRPKDLLPFNRKNYQLKPHFRDHITLCSSEAADSMVSGICSPSLSVSFWQVWNTAQH